MANLIAVRIQMGVDQPTQFKKNIFQDSTVDDVRQIIRNDQDIAASDGIVLIWNGQRLRNSEVAMSDLGICNESLIIAIISKEKGRDIEQLLGEEEDEKYEEGRAQPVLECTFATRPLGFAVWANENAENAIVTSVGGKTARDFGVKIGYCIYQVNGKVVFNQRHKDVLKLLKDAKTPLQVTFVDLGQEYMVPFESKPLGFTVVQDKEERNAKVSKINTKKASKDGVLIGSYITAVNADQVFGLQHQDIIGCINNSKFPLTLTFRHPPKLLVTAIDKSSKKDEKKKKLFNWLSR